MTKHQAPRLPDGQATKFQLPMTKLKLVVGIWPLVIICFLVIGYWLFPSSNALAASSPFTVMQTDEELAIEQASQVRTSVLIRIPEGHLLYKEMTSLEFKSLDEIRVKSIQYPEAQDRIDPVTGKMAKVFPEGDLQILITFYAPETLEPRLHTPEAVLRFQGCSQKLCLRPEEHLLNWNINIVAGTAVEGGAEPARFNLREALKQDFSLVILRGHLIAFIIAFLGGLLTSLTPCVLPIVPVILLIVGFGKKRGFLRNLGLASLLVAGMVITYSMFGVAAVAIGKNIGFLFQERWFLFVLTIFFALMGLSMLGLWQVQLPSRLRETLSRLGGSGYKGAFLMGMSTGLLAMPCVGPVLGSMLVWVSLNRQYSLGLGLLASFGAGMGLFYVVIGTFYGALSNKIRVVSETVKKVIGISLIIVAIYYLGAAMPLSPDLKGDWFVNDESALRLAEEENKPIMIVFGAKWCPPCIELRATTLRDERVIAKGFVMLYVDTSARSDVVSHLIEKYNVVGWPTIIFASPDGKVYDELTVVGEVVSVEELVGLMEKAIALSGKR